MSIRAVKRLIKATPTLEGAGVKLQRAFGFGETEDFDPFLLLDDFRNDRPQDYLARLPVASAPRHRDHHLRAGRHRRTRRQPRQSGHARRRRRPMDDGRQRHHPPGDAEGRRRRAGCTAFSSGPTSRVAQDDGAALSGRQGGRHSRSHRRRRHARARRVRRLLGHDGTGGGDRGRAALSRHLGAAWRARRRLPVETTRHAFAYVFAGSGTFRDASAPRGGADRAGSSGRTDRWLSRGRRWPAIARWCCSTAATR